TFSRAISALTNSSTRPSVSAAAVVAKSTSRSGAALIGAIRLRGGPLLRGGRPRPPRPWACSPSSADGAFVLGRESSIAAGQPRTQACRSRPGHIPESGEAFRYALPAPEHRGAPRLNTAVAPMSVPLAARLLADQAF